MYSLALGVWRMVYDDPNAVLVLRNEDYLQDREGVLLRISRYAGLPDSPMLLARRCAAAHKHAAGSQPLDVAAQTRKLLEAYFAPFEAELVRMLEEGESAAAAAAAAA
eukprot:CAMPEP_0198440240 /NCGR_PEP_ID=MMETSP1452-20131203/58105_1 /TAXON_ID=1181717 /ORGANISM="Synchroma pusillum, Strain CCMP3072" /LENGTH=107 /DNA_ID=CAMNT_0044160857 /DNA_START=23 /DNA_END=342 /DNA_ORIENTATION=-